MLPKGTIALPAVNGEILDGTVTRPLRSVNPDQQQYSGVIRVVCGEGGPEQHHHHQQLHADREFEFGIMGLVNKRELLQVGDPVQLQVSFQLITKLSNTVKYV